LGQRRQRQRTTARVFATFLTWMSEKTASVFLIATANDVSALPPEMMRKGRFDEIFFIDLPEDKERGGDLPHPPVEAEPRPKKFIEVLSKATEGFSGAEIEQVVVGGLYNAFDADRELIQKDLLGEARSVVR